MNYLTEFDQWIDIVLIVNMICLKIIYFKVDVKRLKMHKEQQ